LNPPNYYKEIWNEKGGWGGFFGTGYIPNVKREYLNFTDVKKFANSKKIKSKTEWFDYAKKEKLPNNIPLSVDKIYKKAGVWQGWADFLGKNNL
jgi:hypothetical protein